MWAVPVPDDMQHTPTAAELDVPEATTHADLAVAYREMGLFEDALLEAAQSLKIDVTGRSAEIALGVLLSSPLLIASALDTVRRFVQVEQGSPHSN